MKFYYLKEVTDWKYENHTYIFESKKSMKCLGYIKSGSNEVELFKKPYLFDKKRRTFVEVIVS